MAVTNDQIRPPITIQNNRNKQSFDTYAFTVNIVLLVLQDYYFTGLILEYKGIIVKVRHTSKRKAKKEKKAHPNANSRPSTGVDTA